MADPEHVEIVKRGADAIDKWRVENPDVQLDLSGAVISLAECHEAFLANADLTGVTLSDTDVSIEYLYGTKGVVQDLKSKVDSHVTRTERSKKRVRLFFRFLNWSVSKLLGTDLINAGSEFKENVESWQLNQREHFPASEGIELAIAAFVRFVRVGFISLLIAMIPISFQIAQTFLMNRQNTLINDQNKYFQEQNSKIQKQLDEQDIERRRTNRNRLLDILYQEKDVEKNTVESLLGFVSKKKRRKVPKANVRSRQAALIDFIKLERDNGREIDLRKALLSDLDLRKYHAFKKAGLQDSLIGANLQGAQLDQANLSWTNLEGANLAGANLRGAHLDSVNLKGANLKEAHLEGAYLAGAHLEGANLIGAHFEKARMVLAHLERSQLKDTHFEGAFLMAVKLNGADLRWGVNFAKPNTPGPHFEGADLSGVDFESAIVNAYTIEISKMNTRWQIGGIETSSISSHAKKFDWIENLRNIVPSVKRFDNSHWSVAERRDEKGKRVFLLVGPAEAKKPILEN